MTLVDDLETIATTEMNPQCMKEYHRIYNALEELDRKNAREIKTLYIIGEDKENYASYEEDLIYTYTWNRPSEGRFREFESYSEGRTIFIKDSMGLEIPIEYYYGHMEDNARIERKYDFAY